MSDDTLLFLDRAIAAVEPLVASVSAADHLRSTPCKDFDLGTLVAHLVGGLRGFADVGEGKPLRFDADPDITTEQALDDYRPVRRRSRRSSTVRRPTVGRRLGANAAALRPEGTFGLDIATSLASIERP